MRLNIKSWQLLLVLVTLVVLSGFLLRQNNLNMVKLRNQVLVADQKGRDVEPAIKALNKHVFSHMNTEIVRPIELVNTYNRQAEAAIKRASQSSGRDIYAEATSVCERQGIPITSIAQCAADYASRNNPGVNTDKIQLPDKNRFTYTFAAPVWTPDAAGFAVLTTVIVAFWLIVRLIEYVIVRIIVRRRVKAGIQ